MPLSDSQLLSSCRKGDESAWEALVQRYQRLIYAIPKRAGLDEDEAADVFQEVFTTLFKKLDDIEEPDRLHAWLVTTARRTTWRVISKARLTRQRRGAGEDDEADESLLNMPDDAALPDEVLSRMEAQHRVRMAVAALDERCRKLIMLLFYEAETPSYAQIAASLGTSEGSVGPTRARCLEKTLRLLEKL